MRNVTILAVDLKENRFFFRLYTPKVNTNILFKVKLKYYVLRV